MHALKRVVLYARYSTDQQNPASIETQLDLGKEFILRQGWHLADTFVDAGVSGSSFETRPGLQAALARSDIAPMMSFSALPSTGFPAGSLSHARGHENRRQAWAGAWRDLLRLPSAA